MDASTPDSEVSTPLESPSSPPVSPPLEYPTPAVALPSEQSRSSPIRNDLGLRSVSASAASSPPPMTASSTPLGTVNAARRPNPPPISSRGAGLSMPQDILARVEAVRFRGGVPGGARTPTTPGTGPMGNAPPFSPGPGGVPIRLPPGMARPGAHGFQSAPAVPNMRIGGGLADKRGVKLPGGLPGTAAGGPTPPGRRKGPGLKLSQMNGDQPAGGSAEPAPLQQNSFEKYSQFIDTKSGTLNFNGKAILNSEGVKFAGGTSFSISLDEVDTLDELGKGNYGTVYKVRHSRPRMRKPGQGLAGNKSQGPNSIPVPPSPTTVKSPESDDAPSSVKTASGTGVVMAMKEIRLELDDAKFAAIIMELDILHRCVSPYIIDFYGAFFQEGAVYICIEFMDGGSVDKIYHDGVPESVLRKIAYSTTKGLKFLKEEHNIIHRDVKPTNILVNTRGHIKICDFGVSGNLVASIAKTNIGCQSYMAPERISSGGIAQAGANPGGGTYSVQSDIWSLGLTIIECALGAYPYPPETYNNIFSQLSAIVDGEPPDLPEEGFSDAARNFVKGCLNKIPNLRPTYAMLLQHVWLASLDKPAPIVEESEEDPTEPSSTAPNSSDPPSDALQNLKLASGADEIYDKEVADWVQSCLLKKRNGTLGKGKKSVKPALHAAPLDAMSSPGEVVNGSALTGEPLQAGAS